MSEAYYLQGNQGGVVMSAGDVWSTQGGGKKCRWVGVLQDTVLTGVVGNLKNAAELEGVVLKAGSGLGGEFSEFEVVSGKVIGYFD